MERTLELCPICKEKFLVGLHRKSCMRKNPVAWINYETNLLQISINRKGRYELIEEFSKI